MSTFPHHSLFLLVLSFCPPLPSAFAMGRAPHPDRVAPELIAAFKGGCQSSGTWTSAAQEHTRSLISILESLRSSDACKPFADRLIKITAMGQQIDRLLTQPEFSDYRASEEKLQDLTLAYGSASDPALKQLLGSYLVTVQVDMAQARAAWNQSQATQSRDAYKIATRNFADYTTGLLSQSEGMISSCLRQSPQSAVQLANNLIALGGSFAAPVYGAATSVISQLLNVGLEYSRQAKLDKKIWELYGAELPTAMSCGMEAMTELYCQANDAYDLIEVQKKYSGGKVGSHPVWAGMDLIGRRLPVVSDWLLSLRNGILPSDPHDAARQNQVWDKLNKLDSVNRQLIGNIRRVMRLYNDSSEMARTTLMVELLQGSSYLLVVGSDIPNPFAELSSDPLLQGCWLVLGPEGKCPAFEPNKENLETYVRAKLLKYNPTPITVLENLSLIYLTVKKKVDVEFFNTITVNSESLLNAAFTASVDNVSPREVLTLLQSFLEDLSKQDNSRNPQRAAYIESTLKIVKEASEILDNRGKNLSSLSQIQKLFDLLDLRSGTAVTMQRFEDLIRSDLLEKLKSGDIPKDIEEILRVSGGNIESRLLASGVKNLDLVVGDLNAARQLTQQNITQFRDFFNAALGRSVLSLDKWARDAGEDLTGSNRPNGQVLGRLCALALSTQTTWTPWISWDICSRSALYSVYPDPDRKLQIQVGELQKTISSKLQSRYCTIHKFHQASRLAEILKDRVPVETLFDSLMDGSQ